ncbi:hypothetical protein F5Y05DRAFT_379337 [Hypoxylon sp. FL0543]|nr:hypothetical protein F5Y05DRAFT_379337 [Hypoxylon sp. FL0543]
MLSSGLNQSPYVPWNFEGYLDLKRKTAEAKQRAILKRLEDRERDLKQIVDFEGEHGKMLRAQRAPAKISKKLLCTHGHDNLTCINAHHAVWCDYALESGSGNWPDKAEFARAERRLPLPRLRQPDEKNRRLAIVPDPVPLTGPDVTYFLRKVATRALNPTQHGLLTSEMPNLREQTKEIDIRDVNPITVALLNDIYKDEYSAI